MGMATLLLPMKMINKSWLVLLGWVQQSPSAISVHFLWMIGIQSKGIHIPLSISYFMCCFFSLLSCLFFESEVDCDRIGILMDRVFAIEAFIISTLYLFLFFCVCVFSSKGKSWNSIVFCSICLKFENFLLAGLHASELKPNPV